MAPPDNVPTGLEAVAFWHANYQRSGFVYAIQGDEGTPIKIGRAVDVAARLRGLQTGNPQILRVVHAIPGDSRTEAAFHRYLAAARVQGEWFAGPRAMQFLDWLGAYSDELIRRFEAGDRTRPGLPPLPDPSVYRGRPIQPRRNLRSMNVRNHALLGHSWRTQDGTTPAPLRVQQVTPGADFIDLA